MIRPKRISIERRGLGIGSGKGTRLPLASAIEAINPSGLCRQTGKTGGVERMTIAAILSNKGSEVETIDAGASVADAVGRLGERRIGALPVIEGGEVSGIISERDVIYCLREHGAEVLDWPVSRIMTSPAITVDSQTAVLAALATMTKRRIRHLPVVEGGSIRGIVSIGDLVKHRIEMIEQEAAAMRSYIQGA
jgi:CBS domain-containing protein